MITQVPSPTAAQYGLYSSRICQDKWVSYWNGGRPTLLSYLYSYWSWPLGSPAKFVFWSTTWQMGVFCSFSSGDDRCYAHNHVTKCHSSHNNSHGHDENATVLAWRCRHKILKNILSLLQKIRRLLLMTTQYKGMRHLQTRTAVQSLFSRRRRTLLTFVAIQFCQYRLGLFLQKYLLYFPSSFPQHKLRIDWA